MEGFARWVVQLRQGSRRWQHKLVKAARPNGKDTEQQAYQRFNQPTAKRSDTLPALDKIRMVDLLRVF